MDIKKSHHPRLYQPAVALADESTADLKPPPTAPLFAKTPMAAAQSTPRTSLCSAPLSDPMPTQELWSKIKQTNTLFSAGWSPLDIRKEWKPPREMCVSFQLETSWTGVCSWVCVRDLKPCSMQREYVFACWWATVYSVSISVYVSILCIPLYVSMQCMQFTLFCMWPLCLRGCMHVRLNSSSGLSGFAPLLLAGSGKSLNIHQCQTSSEEARPRLWTVCVGAPRYKEHKKCRRPKSGTELFFSFQSPKARAGRCHNSVVLAACNLQYCW